MKTHVFSVLDSKVGSYAQPWFSPTIASGIRAFTEAATDPASMLAKHPGDFTLYLLGTFDDETGVFQGDKPTALGTAASMISNPERA